MGGGACILLESNCSASALSPCSAPSWEAGKCAQRTYFLCCAQKSRQRKAGPLPVTRLRRATHAVRARAGFAQTRSAASNNTALYPLWHTHRGHGQRAFNAPQSCAWLLENKSICRPTAGRQLGAFARSHLHSADRKPGALKLHAVGEAIHPTMHRAHRGTASNNTRPPPPSAVAVFGFGKRKTGRALFEAAGRVCVPTRLPKPKTACPSRSGWSQAVGSPFFAHSLWRNKESKCAAWRTSRLPPSTNRWRFWRPLMPFTCNTASKREVHSP